MKKWVCVGEVPHSEKYFFTKGKVYEEDEHGNIIDDENDARIPAECMNDSVLYPDFEEYDYAVRYFQYIVEPTETFVVRAEGPKSGTVVFSINEFYEVGYFHDNWLVFSDEETWKEITEKEFNALHGGKQENGSDRGDGGMVSYYEIPSGATQLSDLIEHKDMRHGIGEAFCALYRLKDTGDELRNLKKAQRYIERAIDAFTKVDK